MSSTLAVKPSLPTPQGYLQQSLPAALILGTFFCVTMPLCMLSRVDSDLIVPILWTYTWLFGMTHFVLTLTIYLQSNNLRYFTSTWTNRCVYIAIPLFIFVGLDLYHAFGLADLAVSSFPVGDAVTLGLLVGLFIRLADFNHLNRQSFGVFQLFKSQSGCSFPRWMKPVENYFFFGLTLLLLTVFANKGQFPLEPRMTSSASFLHYLALALVAVTAILLVALLIGFYQTWQNAPESGDILKPAAYFFMQTTSAALAIYSLPLYVAALAIHYVEYHVLMAPRCFRTTLDPQSRVDRFFARLRGDRRVFYCVLLSLAGVVTYLSLGMAPYLKDWVDRSGSTSYLALIYLFDGLILFHYFIEAFIWRFSEPFYRKSLGPLYFPRPAPVVAAAESSTAPLTPVSV